MHKTIHIYRYQSDLIDKICIECNAMLSFSFPLTNYISPCLNNDRIKKKRNQFLQ